MDRAGLVTHMGFDNGMIRRYLILAASDLLVGILFDAVNVFAKAQLAEVTRKFLLLFGGLLVPLWSQGEPGYPVVVKVFIYDRSGFSPAGLGVLRVFFEYFDNLVRACFDHIQRSFVRYRL